MAATLENYFSIVTNKKVHFLNTDLCNDARTVYQSMYLFTRPDCAVSYITDMINISHLLIKAIDTYKTVLLYNTDLLLQPEQCRL